MIVATKPFLKLTASDLMSRDVVLVPQQMSLRAAAHLLAQANVTGAPVVDGQGRCVGVISATDFLRRADEDTAAELRPPVDADVWCDWQVDDLEALPEECVRQHMTPDPVTVSPQTAVQKLAQMMIDAHIHRVIVVDPLRRPIGIVTATDILASVASMALSS